MKKITLRISGREMTFSEEELISILESHFANQERADFGMPPKPMEGKWFEVNPRNINKELFAHERKDSKQEWTRQIILKAFAEIEINPGKYGRPFKTMMPEKTWSKKTVEELKNYASNLGDYISDWVEQALEWAQRIANGEDWEELCNKADTANWHRLVVWENGYARVVGGAREHNNSDPASDVGDYNCESNLILNSMVPLVVSYK